MNDIIYRRWQTDSGRTVLARFRLYQGGLVMAFQAGVRHPLWVAKWAGPATARVRLRQEKSALEWLLPWRSGLRIPCLLGWEEGEQECCLIASGMAGSIREMTLSSGAGLDAGFGQAAGWLQRFQQQVPCFRTVGLPSLQASWLRDYAEAPEPDGFSSALWESLRSLPVPRRPAVPVHGDFWSGNLLFDGNELSVIDWNGLQAGAPLDDLLTLLLKAPVQDGRRRATPLEGFRRVFFTASAPLRLLRAQAAAMGLNAVEGCYCFYSFLARRLRWELSYGRQSRSLAEQNQARAQWRPILEWLAEQDYPDPFARVSDL